MGRMERRASPRLLLALLAVLAIGCSSERAIWKPAPRLTIARASPPRSIDRFSPGRASPGVSAFWLAFVDAAFLGFFGVALGLSRMHARRARAIAAFDPRAALRPGPAVVFGVVEPEPGASPAAVSVEIDQQGTETQNKGNWHHSWNERTRRVLVRPFFIRNGDGARVQIIPDDRVALEDDLSRVVRTGHLTRTRVAELLPGETVHITGWLDDARSRASTAIYRDAAREPTLRPPRLGRMVISTERPGGTESGRARFHRIWAIAFAVLLALFPGLVLGYAHILVADGVVVEAKPTFTRHWQVWVKPKNGSGHWVQKYAVRAEHRPKRGAPLELEDRCTGLVHDCVAQGRCATVPFVISETWPTIHQVGRDPTISVGGIVLALVVIISALILYWATTLGTRPWYARGKVNEGGSGRLPPMTADA